MIPPTPALADVGQLRQRPVHLTPPLRWFSAPEQTFSGSARTVQLGVGPVGAGLGPLRAVLSEDLAGQVVVLAGAAGAPGAVWGEILSAAAAGRGAVAALIDGPVRDAPAVRAARFPVAGASLATAGPAGLVHVVDVGVEVRIGEVTVADGDLVIGDEDGIVAVDAATADVVVDAACRYAAAEEAVMGDLRAGVPIDAAYRHKADAVAALDGAVRPAARR
ncbi:MAG: hypothetical protein S0880_21555 [Actinomycetota bacterium]|nr:hypothetical protein [Actinomycetota bacterium]